MTIIAFLKKKDPNISDFYASQYFSVACKETFIVTNTFDHERAVSVFYQGYEMLIMESSLDSDVIKNLTVKRIKEEREMFLINGNHPMYVDPKETVKA